MKTATAAPHTSTRMYCSTEYLPALIIPRRQRANKLNCICSGKPASLIKQTLVYRLFAPCHNLYFYSNIAAPYLLERMCIMTEAPLPAQPVSNNNNNNNTTSSSARKRRSVRFSALAVVHHCFEGVTPEEADNVWFRRTEYVEFVENELRRRELLSAIEAVATDAGSSSSEERQRRASTPSSHPRATLQQTPSAPTTKSNIDHRTKSVVSNHNNRCKEGAMKHTFSKRMVSRTLSSGPPRRRRQLPRREQNDMDAIVLASVSAGAIPQTKPLQTQPPPANANELPFVVDPTSPARRQSHTGNNESSKNLKTETPTCIAARAS